MEQQFEECVRLWNEYNGMLVHYNEPNDLLSQGLQRVYDNSAPLNPSMEMDHSMICDNWLAKETILVQNVIECTNLLLQRGDDVRSRLQTWKEKQMRAQIGYPFPEKDTELAIIDSEFGTLFDYIPKLQELTNVLLKMLKQPMGMPENAQSSSIAQLNEANSQLNRLSRELLHQVLVVSEQPKTVLKTETNIRKMEIHFLAAEKLGMKHESNMPNVHFKIITEELAKQLTDSSTIKEVGEIENAEGKFAVNANRHMTVKFSKNKLISVEHRTNVNSKKEQKYVLFFYTDPLNLKIFGKVNLRTLSLPVMVATSGSQDCDLYAAVFWQRAFGSVDYHGNIADEAQSVTWPRLAEAIKYQFQSFTGATRCLTQLDTDYIAEKMFGPAPTNDPMRQGMFIDHPTFVKEYMNSRVEFSYWDWFYSIMRLIKEKEILQFWNRGWLIGFISYDDATRVTMMSHPPTFLLRFSEGTQGALSIAGVVDTVTADRQRVERLPFHLSPMGISDLKKMSLVETLQVNQDLCYLYPEVTKASILAHFGIAAPVSAAPVSATPFSQPRYKQPIKSESAVPPELNRLFHNCAV